MFARTRLVALLVALVGSGLPISAQQPPLAKFEPPTGSYIGAYIRLDEVSGGDIGFFENMVGKKHASYFRYVGYGQPFPSHWVEEVEATGGVPHIAWEPNDGLEPVRDDEYLRTWAATARDAAGPIFRRYASEMNGTWMAYSGDPELYIQKWRIVHRVMAEIAPNVAMVWCPFATPVATIDAYYPGDEYVDWVGVNLYSVHVHDNDPNKPADEDPHDLLDPVYTRFAARKPIQICEYAASHYCAATKKQLTEFAVEKMTRLYDSLRTKYPRVKMINWFNVDTAKRGLAANDYSVTGDPRVLERYRALVADAHFLSNIATGPVVVAVAPTPAEPPTPPGETEPAPPAEDAPEPLSQNPLKYIGPQPDTGVNLIVRGQGARGLSGKLDLLADVGKNVRAEMALFKVDGRAILVTSVQPFRCTWDTTEEEPGEHTIEVTLLSRGMREVAHREVSLTIPGRAEGSGARE